MHKMKSIIESFETVGHCLLKQVAGLGPDVLRRMDSPSSSPTRNRWLNVVLDLNGILCVCKGFKSNRNYMQSWNQEDSPHSPTKPAKIGPKFIFVRPNCKSFLRELSTFA